jgi:hypothetical protein
VDGLDGIFSIADEGETGILLETNDDPVLVGSSNP